MRLIILLISLFSTLAFAEPKKASSFPYKHHTFKSISLHTPPKIFHTSSNVRSKADTAALAEVEWKKECKQWVKEVEDNYPKVLSSDCGQIQCFKGQTQYICSSKATARVEY